MALSTITQNAYQVCIELLESNKEYKRYALTIGASLLLGGSWLAYRYYATTKENSAQEALTQCMNMHAQAASGDVQWSDVESMSSASLDSYRSTAVGPYLMACRIDALRAQGNYQEALAQSENLLGSLSKSNPLYPSFQVKDALLNLDYGDDAAQQRAQATLQAIGSDAKNPVADRALYYLGSYQESIGEHEQARQTWQQLVELGAHEDRFLQSPYLSLVQSKL